MVSVVFFFNDTATTEIYTLSLHDALPIYQKLRKAIEAEGRRGAVEGLWWQLSLTMRSEEEPSAVSLLRISRDRDGGLRSEEHTSELQSRQYLVCRLLLEKKKKNKHSRHKS